MRASLRREAGIACLLGALLIAPAAAGEREPVATTPHFAFYSDFATNVNDALIAAGLARSKGQPEPLRAGEPASCFDALRSSARAGWDRAVDYYAEIVSPADFLDHRQVLLRLHLAGDALRPDDAGSRQYVAIADGMRAAAAPAYESCRWPARDSENREWIEALGRRLATHEQAIARRLEKLYETSWNGLPVLVDVVETVSWSGANSVPRDPAGGHLLISTSYRGPAALEIVFHEASHLLVGRDDPLQQALDRAARALDLPVPDDLWHPLMFYTTGETVRRVLQDAGEPDYTPMIFEIFGRSRWGRYQQAIERTWPAYLDGEQTLSEAARALLRAIAETAGS